MQLAYSAAHRPVPVTCGDEGSKLYSLHSPQNVLACVVGDDELTLHYGQTTTDLRLGQYSTSYYCFKTYKGSHEVGLVMRDPEEAGNVTPFNLLVNDPHLAATLGELTEGHFAALDDSTFRPAVRRVLAGASPRGGTGLFCPGYALQQGVLSPAAGLSYRGTTILQRGVAVLPRPGRSRQSCQASNFQHVIYLGG